MMWYLSDLMGLPICNESGERIAQLRDLVVRVGGEGYPPVSGLVTRSYWKSFYIPWERVRSLDQHGIRLLSAQVSLHAFHRREGEMLLVKDVLDKQVLDVGGRRVVRANDLRLVYRTGLLILIGIDVSPQALVRRILPGSMRVKRGPGMVIDWRDIEQFASESPGVRLKIDHQRLSKLNPVDIAHIIEDLSYHQGAELVESLDDATAADALEEMSEELQADILEGMDEERAADILQEMNPDDAADVLAALAEDRRHDLLRRMDRDDAADVQTLLQYEADDVGGIMTTDLVTVTADQSASQVIESIRRLDEAPDVIYYVYVVEGTESQRLLGVTTLRDVLLASPEEPVGMFMRTDVQTAEPHDDAKEAARLMSEYNLLALPVVDANGRLLGVVTVDDAMELLLPDQFRKQMPRVFS